MKIRNGFVSNSSSSSFIVGFKKVPTTIKEMQKMLFEHIKKYGLADWEWKDWVDTADIARLVLEAIRKNKQLTKEQFIKEFINSTVGDLNECTIPYLYPNLLKMPRVDWEKILPEDKNSEYWKNLLDRKIFAAKIYDEHIMPLVEKLTFYFFSFDFATNIGTIMEEGQIFRNLPYLRIMKH